MMADAHEITQDRANWRDEYESAWLYRRLAAVEKDPIIAEIYQKMAAVEEKHRAIWESRLQALGQATPSQAIGWRTRVLGYLAKRFGAGLVLPLISAQERRAVHGYDQNATAIEAGMPADERSHARLFTALDHAHSQSIAGPRIAQIEGRHRTTGGGNALRAAVLGASDGLTSNLSLVMGVAGATLAGHGVLLAGIAGMLAGGLSMAIGEWLSVQSARDLYEQQMAVERIELQTDPSAELEELALIYQAKGIDQATAQRLAAQIMAQGESVALDTLAREELGLDPQESASAAMIAAITSFLFFTTGAIIPVLPFFFGGGLLAVGISLAASIIGLFIIGVGISLTTGIPLLRAGSRQVILGVLAALVTFSIGKLLGGAIG